MDMSASDPRAETATGASTPPDRAGRARALWSRAAASSDPPARGRLRGTESLARLTGAGPGLIWLLDAHGIRSIADLALQDAGTLSHRLGLVGQLVDLQVWIDRARAAE